MFRPLMRISTPIATAATAAILMLGTSLGCPSGPVDQGKPGGAAKPPAAAPKADGAAPAAAPGGESPGLRDPSQATATAPDQYKVKLTTTKGDVVVQVHRDWAPNGADRFYNMVQVGFMNDLAFFRAMDNFMVQFGMHGDPTIQQAWSKAPINDEPVKQSNKRGMITFAKRGVPNSRTTQIFINYRDNAMLDGMGFAPFGEVVEGMEVLESLYKGYGDGAPKGRGPAQPRIEREGNAYLRAEFPKLDYLQSATIVQ